MAKSPGFVQRGDPLDSRLHLRRQRPGDVCQRENQAHFGCGSETHKSEFLIPSHESLIFRVDRQEHTSSDAALLEHDLREARNDSASKAFPLDRPIDPHSSKQIPAQTPVGNTCESNSPEKRVLNPYRNWRKRRISPCSLILIRHYEDLAKIQGLVHPRPVSQILIYFFTARRKSADIMCRRQYSKGVSRGHSSIWSIRPGRTAWSPGASRRPSL